MAKAFARVEAMARGARLDPNCAMQPERVDHERPVRFVHYYRPDAGPVENCRIKGQTIRNVVLTTRERGQRSKIV